MSWSWQRINIKHVQKPRTATCYTRKCFKLNVSSKFVENLVRLSTINSNNKNQTSISVPDRIFFGNCRNVHFSIKIHEKADDSCLHSLFCYSQSNFSSTNYREGQIIEANCEPIQTENFLQQSFWSFDVLFIAEHTINIIGKIIKL